MSGWIRIERKLWRDHPFFDDEPMSEREAWCWLIANAAWEDTRHKVGKEMLEVKRGSFMVTLREMQSAFMWRSDTKVRNFLKRLEQEGMIERTAVGSRNAPKTHVTICNYEEYQGAERTKRDPKTHRERTKNAVKEQINNKTKEPNGSKDAGAVSILSPVVGHSLASEFVAHRREMKKPMTERAAAATVRQIEGHHDPCAVLVASIANGWQGVFPEKIKPQFKAINGGQNDRDNQTARYATDPALEQIARLSGISKTSG
jgi:hypothetical protein